MSKEWGRYKVNVNCVAYGVIDTRLTQSIEKTGGKIEIDNTYDQRLKMCETDALPDIRNTLFGENENRHFKN